MLQNNQITESWQLVKALVGRTIKGIHLVAFVFKDEVKWENTFLQISFTDDSVILLDGEGDGETLRVQPFAWVDPFAGVLDQTNKEFIQTHGKWELFDVSNREPFNQLLTQPVDAVQPIFNKFGKLHGVQIFVSNQCLNFVIEWDEGHISWGSG
jgi:hypothetical protein